LGQTSLRSDNTRLFHQLFQGLTGFPKDFQSTHTPKRIFDNIYLGQEISLLAGFFF